MTTRASDRERGIVRFLEGAGWGGARRGPLAGDASFRRYDRIENEGRRAVLMDAPPPQEDVRPFLRIARHLAALGYSVPLVHAADETAGFLLLEDLGDDTYTRLLAGGADEAALYRLAVDVLVDLHRRPLSQVIPDGTPPYDDQRLLAEARLLVDWYLPAVTEGAPLDDALGQSFDAAWSAVWPVARGVPDTLVLRDFHVDNLMGLDQRPGICGCGLLDFQDAVAGPLTYDLMSLLEDARRDIDPTLIREMKTHYLTALPDLDPEAFAASWAVLAAQRHAKVIGIFTRLCVRDGKPVYLGHIPRVWRLLEAALAHPALAGVAAWVDRHIPPPLRRIPPYPKGTT
ncbi:MAG: aminoglycoside phosphotransferase family protein [Alphaproteobacteria bacterium]